MKCEKMKLKFKFGLVDSKATLHYIACKMSKIIRDQNGVNPFVNIYKKNNII